jgi:hypothetical protein
MRNNLLLTKQYKTGLVYGKLNLSNIFAHSYTQRSKKDSQIKQLIERLTQESKMKKVSGSFEPKETFTNLNASGTI